MIGNDIVDLELAATDSNWLRKGFLDKIFSDSEQAYILNSTEPFQMVWLLWSMKESAYKSYLQKNPKRFFNPKKLVCSLLSDDKGIVYINDQKFSTKSQVTKSYVHTVSYSSKDDFFKANIFAIDTNYLMQHKETNDKLIDKISKNNKIPRNILEIKKDRTGIPRVYKKNVDLGLSISLSHHGRYGAFAIA